MALNGVLIALIAAFVLGSYAVYDKLVVFERVENEYYLAFTSRVTIFLLVGPLLLLPSISIPNPQITMIAFSTGFIYILSSLIYFTGVKHGDLSTMIVFLNTKPALVVIAAAAVLGEALTAIQYIGLATIIGASLLLSFARVDGSVQLRQTAKYGVVFAIVVAIIDIISKYVVINASPVAFFALSSLGMGIGGTIGLGWMWFTRHDDLRTNTTGSVLRAIVMRTIIFTCGLGLFFTSLKTIPVSIASSIAALQSAITVFFVWLLVRIGAADDIHIGDIGFHIKFLAALGIVAGVALISQPAFLLNLF